MHEFTFLAFRARNVAGCFSAVKQMRGDPTRAVPIKQIWDGLKELRLNSWAEEFKAIVEDTGWMMK